MAMPFEQYQNTKHFPALDGIRGISILLVITVHQYYQHFSWTWLSGGLGVQIFFVLSGFLITMLALREERKNGFLNIKAFYLRRSFRIFPLYFLVLALYCVLVFLIGFGGDYDRMRLGAALPYYLLYINEYAPGAPFYQSWSLGIEEKFYLVWPFLAFILFRKGRSDRTAVTALLILTFLLLHPLFPRIGLINYYAILIGCLIAIAAENRTSFERMRFLGSGVWPFLSLALLIVHQLSMERFPFLHYPYPFIVGLWLMSVLMAPPAWLTWRPLTFVGERAYGIYLVHILCIRVVKYAFPASTTQWWMSVMGFVSGTLLSLFVAEFLYRTIERPCIQVGRRLAADTRTIAVPQATQQIL
jgi:peptidoglycan/LPS O-acetylase OafA/YrhL